MHAPTLDLIFCSDIHLSENPPPCRASEPDWFEAMARPLREIDKISRTNSTTVVVCAGDIFDRWNSSPRLINFALEELPFMMYAVPGQHDLPYHRYDDIKRSAYWTLVKAGKIINLDYDRPVPLSNGCELHGFPWGSQLHKPLSPAGPRKVAVVHSYIWNTRSTSYPGASKSNLVSAYLKKLKGFDVAVFGDNHKGFQASSRKTKVVNCGGLMKRKSDEVDYQPCVWLMWSDGVIRRHRLDCSSDEFEVKLSPLLEADGKSFDEVVDFLSKLKNSELDFTVALRKCLNNMEFNDRVRSILVDVLERCVSNVN